MAGFALAGGGAAAEDRLATAALELLFEAGATAGDLALSATFELEEGPASESGLAPITLQLALAELPEDLAAPGLDVAVATASFEGEPSVQRFTIDPEVGGAGPLALRLRLEVPDETDRLVAAVAIGGLWGAAEAELDQPVWEGAPGRLVERDLRPEREPGAAPAPVLRLLPPQGRVAGPVRIRVLISEPEVARVLFELDGQPVGEDDSAPFSALVDFGADATPRLLRAVAYSGGGRRLGEDRLTVNEVSVLSRIRISELRRDGQTLAVAAELELAVDERAERVEFFLNEDRLAELTAPPWRASLPLPSPGPGDFVRVVARLADGTALEDARLIQQATGERVEVNLVEVFAVVTDRQGRPRRDLERDRFVLRLGRQEQPIERFAPAHEVPLVLGLVIDTSGSMYALMPDTQAAGSRFLAETLRAGDRAFLVDFDTRPRLAAALTSDVARLLRRLGGLRADGFTALYDAVIFSMLQFEEEPGRKALVVLTDGDDYRSRFGSRRCIRYGRELGVPVYIIALGGLFGERQDLRKLPLESLSRSTGGRVFYIGGADELGAAYDQIQEELRSQYLLAFATERPLAAEELAEIRVEVRGAGLSVRAVAGAAQR